MIESFILPRSAEKKLKHQIDNFRHAFSFDWDDPVIIQSLRKSLGKQQLIILERNFNSYVFMFYVWREYFPYGRAKSICENSNKEIFKPIKVEKDKCIKSIRNQSYQSILNDLKLNPKKREWLLKTLKSKSKSFISLQNSKISSRINPQTYSQIPAYPYSPSSLPISSLTFLPTLTVTPPFLILSAPLPPTPPLCPILAHLTSAHHLSASAWLNALLPTPPGDCWEVWVLPHSEGDNLIVYCDRCWKGVHAKWCGLKHIPKGDWDWFSWRAERSKCLLCPKTGGMLLPWSIVGGVDRKKIAENWGELEVSSKRKAFWGREKKLGVTKVLTEEDREWVHISWAMLLGEAKRASGMVVGLEGVDIKRFITEWDIWGTTQGAVVKWSRGKMRLMF
jgi:hypothetical protein